jgi:hypothetical protein
MTGLLGVNRDRVPLAACAMPACRALGGPRARAAPVKPVDRSRDVDDEDEVVNWKVV